MAYANGMRVLVGTAGWSIPRDLTHLFATSGSVLQRYASRFNAVEINSSFYRPHRDQTYQRWAGDTPDNFTFAVKAPRQVTHEHRLLDATEPLRAFREAIGHLGDKLGPVLFQLPPRLAFDEAVADRFFATWRGMFPGLTVCEPRHPSWFSHVASERLSAARIGRVIADPPITPDAADLSGPCVYFRLHGAPVMYESSYCEPSLERLAERLTASAARAPTWCIFDNTKFGAATANALTLKGRLGGGTIARKA